MNLMRKKCNKGGGNHGRKRGDTSCNEHSVIGCVWDSTDVLVSIFPADTSPEGGVMSLSVKLERILNVKKSENTKRKVRKNTKRNKM